LQKSYGVQGLLALLRIRTRFTSQNEEFPIGKWKIHFYIKEGGIYTKKHAENLFIVQKILASD
jgi:hypothetical protein